MKIINLDFFHPTFDLYKTHGLKMFKWKFLCVCCVRGWRCGLWGRLVRHCIQCIQTPVCRDPAAHHVCSAPGEQGNLILTSCLLCIDLCSLNDVWSLETQYETLVCSNWIFVAPSRAQGVSMSVSLLQRSFNLHLHLSLSGLSFLSPYLVGQAEPKVVRFVEEWAF